MIYDCIWDIEDKMKLICKDCPKTFKSQLALKYHVRKHMKPHICSVCKNRFASRDELEKHTTEHEGCSQLETEKFQDLNIVTQTKSETPKKLDESQYIHNESPKILNESQEVFAESHGTNEESQLLNTVEVLLLKTNSSDLQRSKRDTLSDYCTNRRDTILKGKAESKDNVSPYIKTDHSKFDGCRDKIKSRDQNKFKEETKGTDNVLVGSNTKEKCKLCNQICKKGNTSTKHMCKEEIKNSNDANHFCNLCEKYYKTKSSFSNHSCRPLQVIKKNKTCEICKKTFKTKEHLRQHQRSHSGEKPFLCVSCGKGFTQQGNLIKHMRIHAGTRMFLCEVCSRPFMTKGALTEHSRTHSDEKQYKCEICQKSFRHKHGLDNHRRKRKYPCNVRKYGENKYPKKKKKGQHADHRSLNEREGEVKRSFDKISVENVARINLYEGGLSHVNHNLNNISVENVARTNNDEKEVHQLNHNFDNNSVENVARNNQNERGVHQLNHNFDKNLVGHVARNTERGVSLVKQNLDKIPADTLASNTAEGVNERVITSTILHPVPTLATAFVNRDTVVSDNMPSSGLTFQGNADFRSLLLSNDTHVFGIEPGIQRLQSFTDMLMADVETDEHEKGFEDLKTTREENQDNLYKIAENYTRINPMVGKETHFSVPNSSNMIAENFRSTDFDIPRSGDKMIKYNQEVYNSQVCKNFQDFQSKATEISHFYPPRTTAYCQLQFNPITHRKARIVNNLGLSECNRISPHPAVSEHRTQDMNVGQNEYASPNTTSYCELQVSPQAAVSEHRTPDMNVRQNEYAPPNSTEYCELQVSPQPAVIEHRTPDMNVGQNEYAYLERSNRLPNSFMNNSCDTFDAKGALESDQPVDNRMVLTFPDKNNSIEHQDTQAELLEQTSSIQPHGFNEIFDRSSNSPQRIEVEMTIEVITEDTNAIQESENIEHSAKHKEDFYSNITPVYSTASEIPRKNSEETDTMSSLVSHKMSNKSIEKKTRSKAVAQTTKAMSEEEILKIIEKAESKNFKCDECNRNFANEYCRSVHVCKKQKESDRCVSVERVSCYTCGRNYSNKYLLKRHSCRPLKQSQMQKILKANMFKFKKKNDAVVESENSESDFESTFKSMQEFLKRSRSALPKSNAKRKRRKLIAKKDTQTIGCENGNGVVESPKKDTVAFVESSGHIRTRRNKCDTMANNINATDTNSAVVGKNKTAKRLGRSKCNKKFHNESKSNVLNLRIDSIGDQERSDGHSECNNARSESGKHQSREFPSDARNDSDKDIRNDRINKDNTNDSNKNTINDGDKDTLNDGDKDTRNDSDKYTRYDSDKDTTNDSNKNTRNDSDKDTRNDGDKDIRNDCIKDNRNDSDKDTRKDSDKYTNNDSDKDTRNDSNKGTRNYSSKDARNEPSDESDRFVCKVCRKSYKNKVNLKKHSCKPTAEETRICKECGKSFNQRNHLLEHMRIHSGEKPYLCKTCGKLFNQESNLMKHMRIHNPQKLFKCEICDREFTQKGALTEHRKVHLSAKPFVCSKCNKGFRHKHGLQHHMDKKFPCDAQPKSKSKVVVDKERKKKVKGDKANTELSVDKITEQNDENNIPIMPMVEDENLPVAAIAAVSGELDNLDEVETYDIWAIRVNTVKSV